MSNANLWAIIMPTKVCNLACDYCYVGYKPTDQMSYALVERVLDELLQHNNPEIPTRIIWHGGEPMLAGIGFYEHVCYLLRTRYQRYEIQHAIQTNGTLLTDDWIEFFKTEGFFELTDTDAAYVRQFDQPHIHILERGAAVGEVVLGLELDMIVHLAGKIQPRPTELDPVVKRSDQLFDLLAVIDPP